MRANYARRRGETLALQEGGPPKAVSC
jgi:hypothetical protein